MLTLLERADLPGIAELAQPEMRLAGLRWNPATRAASRSFSYVGIAFLGVDSSDGAARRVEGLPKGAKILHAEWARSSRHLAVTIEREDGIELWIVDRDRGTAKRVDGLRLNAVLGDPLAWLDEKTVVVLSVPSGEGKPPVVSAVPTGPSVQENSRGKAGARTYQDLLATPTDEGLFEHYGRSEVALVSLDGPVRRIRSAALHTFVNPAPGSTHILVGSLRRPFSYQVPSSRFPLRIEVIDPKGATVHVVADLPLAENMTGDAVRPGPRQVGWRTDEPATLSWIQSIGGSGDAANTSEGDVGQGESDAGPTDSFFSATQNARENDAEADTPAASVKDDPAKGKSGKPSSTSKKSVAIMRDAWYTLSAPFKQTPALQRRFAYRVQGIVWCDAQTAFVTEEWRRTRSTRTWRVDPSKPGSRADLLWSRSTEDRYGDPGRPATVRNALGRLVALRSREGGSIFLHGLGASPEGDRPFLDEFDLATKKARRLWRSEAPWYEEFFAFSDHERGRFISVREAVDTPPNYFLRSIAGGEPLQLTRFAHPYPQFSGVSKELLRYHRADGVGLSGTLYLPAGYKAGDGPLPTLLWAYPREFLSAEAAEQVKTSPYRFVRISATGPLPFLLAGYAVLSDPTMPIIGSKGREPNDTYVEQLVSSAEAAVEALVRRGVSKKGAMAIGGHSYGAFMTANLLVHTRLFAAGIARSGAYNRTLTPFGFQSELRTFWKAPQVYAAMSPFNHADRIKDPLLLIHGGADNNPGTFTLQSERLYAALKGHGAVTRLVILPHESHSYRARESVLHMLWEMESWLDRHVKPKL